MTEIGQATQTSSRSRVRSLILAVLACLALTSIPIILWITRNTDGSEYRYWYGFLDKRWLVAAYFIWVLGLPLMTLVMMRIRSRAGSSQEAAEAAPSSHVGTVSDDEGTSESRNPRRFWVKPVTAGAVLVLAWLLWGPPWVGPSLHVPVEFHESVHFKGLQAILSGSQPFVGAANEQYGPLSQRFVAAWISGPGTESIAGIRTAYLAMNILAIAFLVIVCFAFLRTAAATVVSVVVLTLSPMMSFYGFTDQGMSGFWGWANLWRYSGLLLLGLALPWLAARMNSRSRQLGALAVGAVWAVTTLMAQENLPGGIVVAGAIAVMLVASSHSGIRETASLMLFIGAGALLTWAAYLLPYFVSGRVTEFLSNYLLAPLAVSRGYSGSPWLSSPWYSLYILGPVIMLLAGLLLVLARARHATPIMSRTSGPSSLAPSWTTTMAMFIAATTAQASVLNRADTSHLLNCYVLFPFFLSIFALWAIWGDADLGARLRIPFAVAILLLAGFVVNRGNPGYAAPNSALGRLATAVQVRLDGPVNPLQGEQRRVDAPLRSDDSAFIALSDLTLADATKLTDAIRQGAGSEPVYIDPSLSNVFGPYLGYWYFSADVRPAEVPYEEDSLVLTEIQRQRNLTALRDSGNPICALVTVTPESEESLAVLARIQDPREADVEIGGKVVRIYSCRDGAESVSPGS